MFHFIKIFLKNQSDLYETKTVPVWLSFFLVLACFCVDQAHAEKIVGHHSEIKSQIPCENEYKKYCLSGGECYYLVDENFVGCHCTWFFGGLRCET